MDTTSLGHTHFDRCVIVNSVPNTSGNVHADRAVLEFRWQVSLRNN